MIYFTTLLKPDDPNSALNDRRFTQIYKNGCSQWRENLETTLERVIPFWEDHIAPAV